MKSSSSRTKTEELFHSSAAERKKNDQNIQKADRKSIKRYTNSAGNAISKKKLITNTIEERTQELLRKYGRDNYHEWKYYGDKYGYKTEFLVCLSQIETGIGHVKKTNHNYFNCGNNDSGDTRSYSSFDESIRMLHFSCLGGTYLGDKQTIGQLSPYHKESSCHGSVEGLCQYAYATDKEDWLNNMRNCLSNIRQKQIEEDYIFRK